MSKGHPATPRFGAVWQRATHELQAAGLHFGHGAATAEDEAAWLLIHALGWPLMDSFAAFDALLQREVPADAHARFDALLGQRIATRKPVAYLLGEAWLQGERFLVDERVIVPRSFIAELLQDGLDPWLPAQPRRIADICTGSGCLAILAAQRWSEAQVLGTDISPGALDVARANVALHALQDRVQLLQSDVLNALPGGVREPVLELMLCNPPYVNAQSMRALPQEYRHEPELALAGGADGMDLVRRLLADAPSRLAPEGVLVVEIGNERAHFEAAFPRLPVVWLSTSGGDDAVFLVEAAALRSPA
ncbi:MAG: 50S ribosomal protein L3 N(5)-glutamine methyltransferase [Thiomonas sp.]|uniref:Putative Site-specific DNA-methyltransferase (Adenine-specific) n=1 Tax=mine drainage metagenome TaxID=410659 RepID=E6PRP8_9ZZZZ